MTKDQSIATSVVANICPIKIGVVKENILLIINDLIFKHTWALSRSSTLAYRFELKQLASVEPKMSVNAKNTTAVINTAQIAYNHFALATVIVGFFLF